MNEPAKIEGERAEAMVTALESAPARLHKRLALFVVGALGAGVLGWYYHHLSTTRQPATAEGNRASRTAAASEMRLPPLNWQGARATPPAPPVIAAGGDEPASAAPGEAFAPVPQASPVNTPPPLANAALDRLSSPVLAHAGTGVAAAEAAPAVPAADPASLAAAADPGRAGRAPRPGTLAEALVPTVTEPVAALLVPTQRWLLPKGDFLDCTLETAIDSTLPGMATCVLAADVFGADGRVVLLERGTRLIGETQTEVRNGQSRVAVLWSEARTPTGVSVRLVSPGTDELGRAGVPGTVDNHFGARFGAAILLSLIDGAVSAAVAREQGSSGVIYSVQGPQTIGTEILHNTIGVPPTIRVAPGARVEVLVARDVDFRAVYRLAGHGGG